MSAECVSRTLSWKNKSSAPPLKGGKQVEEETPPWLNCELLSLFKTKREVYEKRKSGQIHIEIYKGITRVCRNAIKKAKGQFRLKLASHQQGWKGRGSQHFLYLFLWTLLCPRPWEQTPGLMLPSVKEELVCELLQDLNAYT